MRFDHDQTGTFSVKKAHIGALFFLRIKKWCGTTTITPNYAAPGAAFWHDDVGRLVVLVRVRTASITVFDGKGLHSVTPKEVTLRLISGAKKSKKTVHHSFEE